MTTPASTPSTHQQQPSQQPHVIIAGGGPAGLLSSILLSNLSISNTVIEKSIKPDEWSTKSYSLNLGARGSSALDKAGVLSTVRDAAMERKLVIIESVDGKRMVIPRDPPHLGFSRPGLVGCLEQVASRRDNVEIRRGAGVTSVSVPLSEDEDIVVHLHDGSSVRGTHVIGADGKWSAVRKSIPFLADQARVRTEPSFGVHIMCPTVPDSWDKDATSVFKPREDAKFYVIAAPIPSGECSVSLVCYEECLEEFPFLEPPPSFSEVVKGKEEVKCDDSSWEKEYSALPSDIEADVDLVQKLGDMLETELPHFMSALGPEPLKTVRINRRTSWLETSGEEISYSTVGGRVVLIGDAAHAVTPSMGEGCNLALESAVSIVEPLLLAKKKEEEAESSSREQPVIMPPTIKDLSESFASYGKRRPSEVRPVQLQSADRNRYLKDKRTSEWKRAVSKHTEEGKK